MKAWRKAKGFSQEQAAAALGISRASLASYESGRRPIPDDVRERMGGEVSAPPQVVPAAKLAGAPPKVVAQAAQAQLAQVAKLPFGVMKGARRPTAEEVERWPHRYRGPDVWVKVYDPPWAQPGGQVIARLIQKGSGTGQGGYSQHLVGTCSKGVKGGYEAGDLPALPPGVYRPFTPGGGEDVRSSAPKGKARA